MASKNYILILGTALTIIACTPQESTTAQKAEPSLDKLTALAIGKPKGAGIKEQVEHYNKLANSKAIRNLATLCGPMAPQRNYKASYTSQIRTEKQFQKHIPKTQSCYANRAEDAWDMRIAQIAYLNGMKPALEDDAQAANLRLAYVPQTLKSESRWYREALSKAARMQQNSNNRLRDYKRKQKRERDSWARAFNGAAQNFNRSMNSGNSYTSTIPKRTADMFIGASPAERLALDNMDRTVFGDQAINNRILRDAAVAGRYSAARKAQSGHSITLTEQRQCYGGTSVQAGNCKSWSQHEADVQSEIAAKDAYYAERASATRAARAARAAELAAERAANYKPCPYENGCSTQR